MPIRLTPTRSRRKFRFKNKLMSLDGSIVKLSATMFDWAKCRQRKGAIKLHLLLDHDGVLDVESARQAAISAKGLVGCIGPIEERSLFEGVLSKQIAEFGIR